MQEILSTKHNVTPAQVLWNRRRVQEALLADKEGLLQRLRPRLLRLAQLRGVPFDAVEDVVQETLLEAWKHRDRLQSLEGMQPWVEEICRNVCRRHARRYWTDMQHATMLLTSSPFDEDEPGEAEASFLETLPDGQTLDLSEELSRQDMTILLNQALGSLPEAARQIVELCYLREMPQREAAARLGLSLSALEARLHRARVQLRQILSGPLRQDAVALGLALDEDPGEGWQETRLWCSLCGRRRLLGTFVPQPDGSVNLHLECPDCRRRYGVKSVHSMGLVQLGKLCAFRPAWKRTMQGLSDQLTRALARGWYPCTRCGAPASIRVMSSSEVGSAKGYEPQVPYQFWVGWQCSRCGEKCMALSADELAYWSHPLARQFVLEHPRWVSLPDRPIEYQEQAAIHFRLADVTSADHLDVLADRRTLRILAVS